MADQPLSLAWLCFLRDHGADLKVTTPERALASALVTYGEGKNIFASMVTLAKVTGMKRDTVIKARRGLQDKGLIEDITGDPDRQSRTYRLTMPGYVSPERDTPQGVQEMDTPIQEMGTPCPPNGTPPVQEMGTTSSFRIKPEIKQHINITADAVDDGCEEDSSTAKSTADDGAGLDHSVDWDDPDDGEALAEMLGVPLAAIGRPFRVWFDQWRTDAWAEIWAGCEHPDSEDCQHSRLADVLNRAEIHAIKDAAHANSPVGYLKATLPGKVATALHKARTASE